jgi:hypothetical protein
MGRKKYAQDHSKTRAPPPNWRQVLKGNADYARLSRKIVALLKDEAAAGALGAAATKAKKPKKGGFKRFVKKEDAQRLLTSGEFERYEATQPMYNMYRGGKAAQKAAKDAGGVWSPPSDWDDVVKAYREFARLSYKAAAALEEEKSGKPRRWRAKQPGTSYAYVNRETAREALSDASFASYEAAREKVTRYQAARNAMLAAEKAGDTA